MALNTLKAHFVERYSSLLTPFDVVVTFALDTASFAGTTVEIAWKVSSYAVTWKLVEWLFEVSTACLETYENSVVAMFAELTENYPILVVALDMRIAVVVDFLVLVVAVFVTPTICAADVKTEDLNLITSYRSTV